MGTRYLKMNDDNQCFAAVVDVDGVLADITNRLHLCPGRPDSVNDSWAVYHEAGLKDAPIEGGWALVEMLYSGGYRVILATSRNDALARTSTEEWLRRYAVRYDELWMRSEGSHGDKRWVVERADARTDLIVSLAVDDDPRHCSMYEDRGWATINVHSGYYEGVSDETYGGHFVQESVGGPEGYREFYNRIGAVPVRDERGEVVGTAELKLDSQGNVVSTTVVEDTADPLQYHGRCGTTHNIISGRCPPPLNTGPWD